ncbi:MAG: PIN domain-containing protein [Candidatus Nitrosopolaris sp.]
MSKLINGLRNPMGRIYLDSNILIDLIIGGTAAKADAKRELYRIRSSYQIFIPQIILGESFSMVLHKSETHDRDKNMTDFWKCIEDIIKDTAKHTPPLRPEILEVALEIGKNDYKLDHNDAVLVAHVVTDKESTALFTSDQGIHNSKPIKDLVNQRRIEGNPIKVLDSI